MIASVKAVLKEFFAPTDLYAFKLTTKDRNWLKSKSRRLLELVRLETMYCNVRSTGS